MPAKGYYKFTLADCQGYARKKGGRCLSEKYHGGRLEWECAQGHRWYQKFKNYSSADGWCRRCVIKKHTLKDVQAYARRHGGRCLSKTYPPTRVKWECRDGHRWASKFSVVLWRKSWCPRCRARNAGLAKRLTLQDAKEAARKKGGKLLSKVYTYSRRQYLWECANGHRWKTSFDKIKNTRAWCPYCSDGSGEESTRICFQKIFRRRFPKKRPEWLAIGGRGAGLELDGFNARLGVAFEHQGRMHYKNIRYFHARRGSFGRRLALDRLKHRLCRQHGVRLVKIPEVGWKFPLERLLPEVIRRCRQKRIRVPAGARRLRINYAPAFNINPDKGSVYLPKMKAFARKMGGSLLDSRWLGLRHGYRFQCNKGHVFTKMPLTKSWCQKCWLSVGAVKLRETWWRKNRRAYSEKLRRKRGHRLKELQDIAKKRGGRCLSKKWDKVSARYKFECGECGRVWMTSALHVFHGKWCRVCASRRSRQKQLARERTERRYPA